MPTWDFIVGNTSQSSALLKFLADNWIALLAALAALGSFLVSYQIKLQAQAPLEATTDAKLTWIVLLLSEDGRSIVNKYGLAMFQVTVINPSNTDVSYFDLRVIDQENSEELNFYKQEQLGLINHTQNMNIHTAVGLNHKNQYINLPTGMTGLLKAHSVTTLSFVVTPKKNTSHVNVIFKVARRHPIFHKAKYGYVNSKYESIFVSSVLDKSSKPDYEELLRAMNEQEHHDKN